MKPGKARKLADDLEETVGLNRAYDKDIAKAREALRDLADQVEELTKANNVWQDAYATAAEEVEALQADAARYRWLRESREEQTKEGVFIDPFDVDGTLLYGEYLDEKIDAAIDAAREAK